MTIVHRSAIVPYSAGQMYDLVDDIKSYPAFLTWCRSAKEESRNADEVHATLELAWGGLSKSFTTCNRLQHHKMMEIRLVNGPFRQLEGFWLFDALGEQGSKVTVNLEFEFSSRLIAMAFGPVFEQMSLHLVSAFSKRADVLYGKR